MAKKIAKLVYVTLLTRVIVSKTATNEQILDEARPKLIDKIRNELGENVEKIVLDTDSPYDEECDKDKLTYPMAKVTRTIKSKTHSVGFYYKGKKRSLSFNPQQEDWWMSFREKDGAVFDVHYCEEYNEICVYEIINGSTRTDKSIHSKKIKYGKV